jgi:uncharacterized protein (TIGR03437 family)
VYEGFVEVAWVGSTETLKVPVTMHLVSQSTPLISKGGVVSAALFAPNDQPGGELVGGMFAAIFGRRLADSPAGAPSVPFTNLLNGVRVTMGGLPSAMVYVSDLQLVVVVPQALTQQGANAQALDEVDVVVQKNGESSPPERIRLAPLRPQLFSQNQAGDGPGAILNVIGSNQVQLNTFDDTARRTQAVSLFGTGFGPTQVAIPDGFAAVGVNPILASVQVLVGGVDAQVLFAGLSPQSPHLYQINVIVPINAPIGCEVPLTVTADGIAANEVTMAVSANGGSCQ